MNPTTAADVMVRFADRTGLGSSRPPRRYLWTDAFAVCNLLGLAESGADPRGTDQALALIDAVHHVLGRHRPDDARRGWISGRSDEDGEAHPTAGGLRIGKPLPERAAGAPPDPRLEWDQDGQYFHYLTRWMHALDQTAWHTGDAVYNCWARELAAAAFQAFSYVPVPGSARRMYWKMSIDLSRPQVTAMGHHDPLDGYLTCLQLETSQMALGAPPVEGASTVGAASRPRDRAPESPPTAGVHETRALAEMVAHGDWATDDPLGLGGLMADAYRLAQLERRGAAPDPGLLPRLLQDARRGLNDLNARNTWRAPAARRLPFRELGLVIGFAALRRLQARLPPEDGRRLAASMSPFNADWPLADRLLAFWLDPEHRRSPTWLDHLDINEVMLATAMAPAGYLDLGGPTR